VNGPVSLVLRSRNDMPLIRETLRGLRTQGWAFQVFAFDNASTDGTLAEVQAVAHQVVQVPEGGYVPGRVLNHGMRVSTSEIVVFLNSDCTPQHPEWLERLVAGFTDERVAAVFGRQIPRPDCQPLFVKDTEDTFGDGSRQTYWKHCFSMASSAIRRSVWERFPFREDIQYSEDIDWTWRMRQEGYVIRYVPDAVVMHSHNYTPAQFYRRMFGEGQAEARIFTWSPWERFWLRYSLLPLARQVVADVRYGVRHGHWRLLLESPVYRVTQMLGRRAGFLAGLRGPRAGKGPT